MATRKSTYSTKNWIQLPVKTKTWCNKKKSYRQNSQTGKASKFQILICGTTTHKTNSQKLMKDWLFEDKKVFKLSMNEHIKPIHKKINKENNSIFTEKSNRGRLLKHNNQSHLTQFYLKGGMKQVTLGIVVITWNWVTIPPLTNDW